MFYRNSVCFARLHTIPRKVKKNDISLKGNMQGRCPQWQMVSIDVTFFLVQLAQSIFVCFKLKTALLEADFSISLLVPATVSISFHLTIKHLSYSKTVL